MVAVSFGHQRPSLLLWGAFCRLESENLHFSDCALAPDGQRGWRSARVDGWAHDAWKAGDAGASPLLPLHGAGKHRAGAVWFFCGRGSSGLVLVRCRWREWRVWTVVTAGTRPVGSSAKGRSG